ncbi:MAG TPA: ATP-binding protein [Pseudonocardiaceae bacterium]|nr:ATP-binding protein [Pseudonocardiaceae bacterium]
MAPPSNQDNRPWRPDAAAADIPAALPAATMVAVLPAEWVAPSIARDRVRRWLTAHRWSPAHRQDLVLAISEAVSNSVEHGYGICAGDTISSALTLPSKIIELYGQVITNRDGVRRVEFTIRDYGRWAPSAMLCDRRGHGMTLMRACADEVIIEHSADGTTVVLRSRPLPRPPLWPV